LFGAKTYDIAIKFLHGSFNNNIKPRMFWSQH